ncbi:hypothetical protein Mgra_00000703 [Meloidogyne graminicola]|uniref:Uncharacterized protein n=1 Tax=Meloidogyne graminicola TaxID=189291 RepID=A0A8T0A4B6_9BILA|nr:hypothetical protein Mgra_00000703 [Meloidogyne graminicola]
MAGGLALINKKRELIKNETKQQQTVEEENKQKLNKLKISPLGKEILKVKSEERIKKSKAEVPQKILQKSVEEEKFDNKKLKEEEIYNYLMEKREEIIKGKNRGNEEKIKNGRDMTNFYRIYAKRIANRESSKQVKSGINWKKLGEEE